MFKIVLKTDLPQSLARAEAALTSGLPGVLQECGVYLASEQAFSFEDKSRGGDGADGKRWKPLKASTERRKYLKGRRKPAKRKDGTRKRRTNPVGTVPESQIGVDTGMLRNAARQGFKGSEGTTSINGTTLVLKYAKSYATHFDKVRPLFPDDTNMPAAWRDGLERIIQQWVDDIAKGIK